MIGAVNDDEVGDDLPAQKAAEKKAKKDKKKAKQKDKDKDKEKKKKSHKHKHKSNKDGQDKKDKEDDQVNIHMGDIAAAAAPTSEAPRSATPATAYSGVGIVTGDDRTHFNIRATSPSVSSLNRISDPQRSNSRSRGIQMEREIRQASESYVAPGASAGLATIGGIDEEGKTTTTVHLPPRHHSFSVPTSSPTFHATATHRNSIPPVDQLIPGPRAIVLIDNTHTPSRSAPPVSQATSQPPQAYRSPSFDSVMMASSSPPHGPSHSTPVSAPAAPAAIQMSVFDTNPIPFGDAAHEPHHSHDDFKHGPSSSPTLASTLDDVTLDMPKIQTRLETWHDLKQAAKRRIWLTRGLLVLDLCMSIAMLGVAGAWASRAFVSELVCYGTLICGILIFLWVCADLPLIGKLQPKHVFTMFLISIACSIWNAIMAAVSATTDRETVESRVISKWLTWSESEQSAWSNDYQLLVNQGVKDLKNCSVVLFVALPIMVFSIFLHLRLHNMISRHIAVVKAQTENKAASAAAAEKRQKQIERYKQKKLYGESDAEDRKAIASKKNKNKNNNKPSKKKTKKKKPDQFTDLAN